MKLVVKERKIIEKGTDIDLPVYFYFQDDETSSEEYVMFDGNQEVRIKSDYFGHSISASNNPALILPDFVNNITTKESFYEAYNSAIKQLKGVL